MAERKVTPVQLGAPQEQVADKQISCQLPSLCLCQHIAILIYSSVAQDSISANVGML